MSKEVKEIIIDFLYPDDSLEEIIDEIEEINDFEIEEISPFEATIHQWLDEELNGYSFNEGSIPLDISCATVHAYSMRMRKVRTDGKVSLLS